jgi:hypothetical protein
MEAKRVINGTYGEAWLDSDKMAECVGLQAKIDFKKEDVLICGKPGTHKKFVGWDGKGSVRLNKVSSRMIIKLRDQVKNLQDLKFTIITKLADPDAFGAERIVLKDVSFDDLTLADWEAAKNGQVECPFTFSDCDFIDLISTDVT